MLDVRESTAFVCEHSNFVSIDQTKVPVVAQKILRGEFKKPVLAQDQQLVQPTKEETAMAAFLLDSINFGMPYWELVSSLKQAFDSKREWLDPAFLSTLSQDAMAQLFSGDVQQTPLLPARHRAFVEIGQGLYSLGKRGAWILIQASSRDIPTFLSFVIERFPTFRDEAMFHGQNIGFYKRAQLLILDLQLMLAANNVIPFRDLKLLTAFADNALPQILRDEGVLTYADSLARRVDAGELLASGSPEEVEIRGNSIRAVELLKEAVNKGIPEARKRITSAYIDTILWTEAETRTQSMKPSHKTVSTNY